MSVQKQQHTITRPPNKENELPINLRFVWYSKDSNNLGVSNKGMEAFNFFGLLQKIARF